MQVNRQTLLNKLESASPGLSPRALIEQSSCFIIGDGRIKTYNEEIACTVPTELELEQPIAVQAAPLLAVLRKMSEETIDVTTKGSELLIIGQRRKVGIRAEIEVVLSLDSIERPKKSQWQALPPSFTEALGMVAACAGKDENAFILTCLHLTSTAIEATDDFQVGRYVMELPIEEPILLRRTAAKCLAELKVNKMAVTPTWTHFRGDGIMISCRQFEGEFPDVMRTIKSAKGEKATFPKALAEAADRASIFAQENSEHGLVLIEIKDGKLRIRGEGYSGWYSEVRKIKFSGDPIRFLIDPNLLIEIIRRYEDYKIGKNLLKVDGGEFTYVTVVGDPDEPNGDDGDDGEEYDG